jgi:acylphosphatase
MTEPTPNQRLCIRVTGRVQGVGFRAFVAQAAQNLGLVGWVRNVGYDQVEAVAEGQPADLQEIAMLVKAGPRISRVDEAFIEWQPASGEFERFDVRASR